MKRYLVLPMLMFVAGCQTIPLADKAHSPSNSSLTSSMASSSQPQQLSNRSWIAAALRQGQAPRRLAPARDRSATPATGLTRLVTAPEFDPAMFQKEARP